MTIATSVIVYPSRLMRMAMMTMAVLLLISAAQLLMIAEHSDRLVLCRLLSLVCVAAAIRFFSLHGHCQIPVPLIFPELARSACTTLGESLLTQAVCFPGFSMAAR